MLVLACEGFLSATVPCPHRVQSFICSFYTLNALACSRLPFGQLLWTMVLMKSSGPALCSSEFILLPQMSVEAAGAHGQELIQIPEPTMSCSSGLWKPQKLVPLLQAPCQAPCPALCVLLPTSL